MFDEGVESKKAPVKTRKCFSYGKVAFLGGRDTGASEDRRAERAAASRPVCNKNLEFALQKLAGSPSLLPFLDKNVVFCC